MSIHFSQIHNLVRTYQHVLNLDAKNPPAKHTQANEAAKEDRVTVSPEAREMQQQKAQPSEAAKAQDELV
ncbi:MAG TPA: hypothetical protein VFA38_09480 [Nitrospirales bacterium]|nr:hypothetical protein [Nitrospirales bacterium]